MKVIKDPIPVSWSIEKKCVADINQEEVGCEAVLEVDYTDIYIKNKQRAIYSDYFESCYIETTPIFVFKCPCCDKENSIGDEEIPIKIRKIIKDREKEKKLEKNKK